jgi:hypothetical protein
MGASIFFTASGRNVNYDEKQLTGGGMSCSFYLYRFRKYVSYGFPIINCRNPGLHYETPCIITKQPSQPVKTAVVLTVLSFHR